MRLMFLFVIVLWLVPQSTWAAPHCKQANGIWANEVGDIRHIVYGSEGLSYNSELYFEEWRHSKLAWRAKGTITCSNGASICYAMVENSSGLSGNDATTDAVVEQIDENQDGLPEWLVFAALGQNLYYSGGAKVEWFNGFGPTANSRIMMPNIYRFFGCRTPGKLTLSAPNGETAEALLKKLLNEYKDRRVRAFIVASLKRTPRMEAVLAEMNNGLPLEKLVREGRISSPADCLPELRNMCFDVLKQPVGSTVPEEWSEWVFWPPPSELTEFVDTLTREALKRGFNLLTNEELAAVN